MNFGACVGLLCAPCLFDLIDEGVYEMFDLWCFGWEQDQLLIGQIELQHVLWRDGHEQDVCVTEKIQGKQVLTLHTHNFTN